jgi:transposase
MELLCLGKVTDRGRIGTNNRLFLEALLWTALRGSRWRDLPYNFSKLNTVLKRSILLGESPCIREFLN